MRATVPVSIYSIHNTSACVLRPNLRPIRPNRRSGVVWQKKWPRGDGAREVILLWKRIRRFITSTFDASLSMVDIFSLCVPFRTHDSYLKILIDCGRY